MKNKIITICLGIGLNMFFPEYQEFLTNPMELVSNNLKRKVK